MCGNSRRWSQRWISSISCCNGWLEVDTLALVSPYRAQETMSSLELLYVGLAVSSCDWNPLTSWVTQYGNSASIYRYSSGSYTLVQKLTGSGSFGWSVSMSSTGEYVAVGSYVRSRSTVLHFSYLYVGKRVAVTSIYITMTRERTLSSRNYLDQDPLATVSPCQAPESISLWALMYVYNETIITTFGTHRCPCL